LLLDYVTKKFFCSWCRVKIRDLVTGAMAPNIWRCSKSCKKFWHFMHFKGHFRAKMRDVNKQIKVTFLDFSSQILHNYGRIRYIFSGTNDWDARHYGTGGKCIRRQLMKNCANGARAWSRFNPIDDGVCRMIEVC